MKVRFQVVLAFLVALIVTMPVVANGGQEEKISEPAISSAEPSGNVKESPSLTKLVEAGELPPLIERLPVNPVVVKPLGKTGVYGGTWRNLWKNTRDRNNVSNHMRYAALVRLSSDLQTFEPDIAESWDISEDGRVFTFTLRDGLRWSDGVPFTTEDIQFFYEDVILNEDLTPSIPEEFLAGGEPAILEIIDTRTFKLKFADTFGLFLHNQAGNYTKVDFESYPKHYLQQFHAEYTDKESLDVLVDAEGVEDWVMLFENKTQYVSNPDLPGVSPWILSSIDDAGTAIWSRNPYYYKVDTEGRQLPYIDKVRWELVGNKEVQQLKATNGEVDLNIRLYRESMLPTLRPSEVSGDYKAIRFMNYTGTNAIQINQTYDDPQLQPIFQDVRFRQAVSLAINRKEMADVLSLGLQVPIQASFLSSSPYYDAEWSEAFTDYDPDRANTLLDEMGLDKRDSSGIRLLPDGRRFEVIFDEIADAPTKEGELLTDYFKDIGIEFIMRLVDRGLFEQRMSANELMLAGWGSRYELARLNLLAPQIVAPENIWGTGYALWYQSAGASGSQPPKDVQLLLDLADKAKKTVDEDERKGLIQQMVDIHKRNVFLIGTIGGGSRVGVVHNRMNNVPVDAPYSAPIPTPAGTMHPEQFYITP